MPGFVQADEMIQSSFEDVVGRVQIGVHALVGAARVAAVLSGIFAGHGNSSRLRFLTSAYLPVDTVQPVFGEVNETIIGRVECVDATTVQSDHRACRSERMSGFLLKGMAVWFSCLILFFGNTVGCIGNATRRTANAPLCQG